MALNVNRHLLDKFERNILYLHPFRLDSEFNQLVLIPCKSITKPAQKFPQHFRRCFFLLFDALSAHCAHKYAIETFLTSLIAFFVQRHKYLMFTFASSRQSAVGTELHFLPIAPPPRFLCAFILVMQTGRPFIAFPCGRR